VKAPRPRLISALFWGVLGLHAVLAVAWAIGAWANKAARPAAPEPGIWLAPVAYLPEGADEPDPSAPWRRVEVVRRSPILLARKQGADFSEAGTTASLKTMELQLHGFDRHLRQLLLRYWTPPTVRLPADQRWAVLSLGFDQSGQVIRRQFVRPSGHDRFDSSVVAAAMPVEKLIPLPKAYGGREYEVRVNFRVE
jgi:TonB family protein